MFSLDLEVSVLLLALLLARCLLRMLYVVHIVFQIGIICFWSYWRYGGDVYWFDCYDVCYRYNFLDYSDNRKGPSHRPYVYLNTLTRSPGRIRNFVSGGSFDCCALLILDSATIVSILDLANFIAINPSLCFTLVFAAPGNVGSTPYTKRDGTRPFGSMVSLIDLLEIIQMILC